MGKLYYDFETNITPNEDLFPPCPEHFVFLTADGNYLEIESQGEEDLEYNNGCVNGEWRYDVMYRRWDASFRENIGSEDFSPIDEDDLFQSLIGDPQTKLVGFRFGEDALTEHGYDTSFVPECTSISIKINFTNNDSIHEFDFDEDRLLTDGELEAAIQSSLGKGGN